MRFPIPVFSIMSGFVDKASPVVTEVAKADAAFVYDTQGHSNNKIGILCENGNALAKELGSMALLMGIPCIIHVRYLELWERRDSAFAFRVVVRLPFSLRKEVVEREMEMKEYFGVVTVGFKSLPELTEALIEGK